MAFKISVSSRAQLEIEKAAEYYSDSDFKVANKFILAIEATYKVLKINPYFRIRYKSARAIPIRRFPHTLYYTVDDDLKQIRILSCFHDKRNPGLRP